MTPLDTARLQESLALAESVVGNTDPNPRVGCVLGTQRGDVLGRGATQPAGSAHAEVMALRDAAAASSCTLVGSTAWVTLEPCAHQGKTPPCCDALIAAGVSRVVVALRDPFPAVAGQGVERMRAAGIQVDVLDGRNPSHRPIAQAAFDLNIGFFSRVLRKRPWVRAKIAASMDGHTALANGQSQWITGEAARTDGHLWRNRAGAVLTGVGTVLADDPALDVRHGAYPRQLLRVVVDSRGRLSPQARVLVGPSPVWVVGGGKDANGNAIDNAMDKNGAVLQARQPQQRQPWPINVSRVDVGLDEVGRVNLGALLTKLAEVPVNELHVEAGATLNGELAHTDYVDEWLLYLAPQFFGSGRKMIEMPGLQHINEASKLQIVETRLVGIDLRIRLQQAADTAFRYKG